MFRSDPQILDLDKEYILKAIRTCQQEFKKHSVFKNITTRMAILVSEDLLYTLFDEINKFSDIIISKTDTTDVFDPTRTTFVFGTELIWCPRLRGAEIEMIEILKEDYIEVKQ